MTASTDPRFIILGGGSVTAEFYLPAFEVLGWLGRVTVVDPFESSLAPMRAAFGAAAFVAQGYDAFLDTLPAAAHPGDAQRIIIALPNRFHVDAVTRALNTNRHVLCEKPLALKAADCRALQDLAAAKGSVLKVAMSRRYLPALMLARQMVMAQELGAVRSIAVKDCMPFMWRPKSFDFFSAEGGGMLADMGVHYLDYLDTLVGPMTAETYTDDARGGIESTLRYGLKAGGVPVDLNLSRLQQSGAYLRIVCDRGVIQVDKADETGLLVTPTGAMARRVTAAQPFDDPTWPEGFHGSFCQMIADFEREAKGQHTPIADVTDAERAAGLIEWAYSHRAAGPARAVSAEARPDILVTGATGFIGGHLVERLVAAGEAVRVTVRSPASFANLARFPVQTNRANLLDPVSARAAMDGIKTVYHLAFGKDADAARITIEGTRNVVEAAIDAGVECVVVLSTMYVFGFPKTEGLVDESFPYSPYGGEYGTSKAAMERWCLERAKTSGKTRIVVLNPTCVFGPEGGAYTVLPADLAMMGQFCWIEGGSGLANYTYVGNVVDALLAAATTPAAHGERFIINDGTSTWRAFIGPMVEPTGVVIPSYTQAEMAVLPRYGGPFRLKDLASAIIGTPAIRQVIKRSALGRMFFERFSRSAAAKGQGEHVFSFRQLAVEAETPVFPPVWLAGLFGPEKAAFSSAKAQRILGWTPRVGLDEATGITVDWLIESGHLPEPKTVKPAV